MQSTWKIIVATAAFFAAVALLLFGAKHTEGIEKNSGFDGMKSLSGTIAEGLSYREGMEPFPRVSCDACRRGKLKAGVFSLSAFTTLEFDNLVVHIPPSGFSADRRIKKKVNRQNSNAGGESAREFIDAMGLRQLPQMSIGHAGGRFAGITVNLFAVNRMSGTLLSPVCYAAKVKNTGKKLNMYDVTIWRNGKSEHVDKALLSLKPHPAIVWQGGIFVIK